LYALAEALVGSLFLLAIAWWFGGKSVFEWSEAGTLDQHLDTVYRFSFVLLFAPYLLGLIAGWLVNDLFARLERLRETKSHPNSKVERFFGVLDASSLLEAPTVWDQTWNQFLSRRVYVRVGTKSGQEIVGAFEYGSWVGLSPEPRQLFLSTVYRENPPGSHNWEPVPRTKGVLIDAIEVEFIEFAG
jgi:hypothetical protein